MLNILLLAVGITLCHCREVSQYSDKDLSVHWENFKKEFKKQYDNPTQEIQKLQVFTENLKIIDQLNAKFNPQTYFGVNHFADLTLQEFKNKYHINFKKGAPEQSISPNKLPYDIPESVDWRKKGAVTPITNQDQCGSSPYFAATTSIEGAWAIAGHPLEVLSVQQIIDCTSNYGNEGCNGGWMNESIAYAADFGLETNTSYPYTGADGSSCLGDAKKVVAKVKGVVNVPAIDDDVTAALAQVPLASAIYSFSSAFQFYKSGIYNDPACAGQQPEHGIGIVGYGQDAQGVKFYILKNWWTTSWGEEGYMRIIRNGQNNCALLSVVSYAVA
eukprot:TRINITY_DN1050_c0_g1_i2.p1 TRINITY_DN1050_c0_g1~~TRINITY_DN1050_c0_g1_i2.p1  ORF type:complete len:330 (-),score=97.13 TRINITY_DN1050_c0_g1_i2:19-1008(-)